MFVFRARIATAMTVLALTCGGVGLTAYSSMQVGQQAQVPPPASPVDPPSKKVAAAKVSESDTATKETNKVARHRNHVQGRTEPLLRSGTLAKHAFRLVNTSNTPIEMVELRVSMSPVLARMTKPLLAAHEEAELVVTVDTRRFRGRRTYPIYLVTDTGKKRVETVFYVTADSQNDESK
jgi:hypothetical protein